MRRGFTLRESLVLLGVFATIAAMLFPYFATDGEYARLQKQVNESRRFATACGECLADYDGTLAGTYFSSDFSPWEELGGPDLQRDLGELPGRLSCLQSDAADALAGWDPADALDLGRKQSVLARLIAGPDASSSAEGPIVLETAAHPYVAQQWERLFSAKRSRTTIGSTGSTPE